MSNATMINANYTTSGQMISAVASSRWLFVSEIEKLLDQDLSLLPLQRTPPNSPPTSGSLMLYDRSATRNYKSDGYDWIKKRNSHKVREDHVKLRVGGKFRVSGCYVHSSSILSFHRRAYHLLDPETGTALHPVGNSGNANKNKAPSLVLVHYLDTKVASEHLNNYVLRGVDVSESLWPAHDEILSRKQTKAKPRSQQQQRHSRQTPVQQQQAHQQQEAAMPNLHVNVQTPHIQQYQQIVQQHQFNTAASPRYNYLAEQGHGNNSNSLAHTLVDTSHALDNKTLDFLWDVIVEEGQDKTLQGSNLSELLVPGVFEQMLERPGAQNLFENKEMLELAQAASFATSPRHSFTAQQQHVEDMYSGTSASKITMEESNLLSQIQSSSSNIGHDQRSSLESNFNQAPSETLIPELIDITPDTIDFQKSAQVVFSLNAPAFSQDDEHEKNGSFSSKYLLAFTKVVTNGNFPEGTIVSQAYDAKMLNPYCFKCHFQPGTVSTGAQKAILLHAELEKDFTESEMIVMANKLLGIYDMRGSPENNTLFENGATLRVSSHISASQFYCIDNSDLDDISSAPSVVMKEQAVGDLPAPAPAMALVATVLSDFPSPPPEAVCIPPSGNDGQVGATQMSNNMEDVDVVSNATQSPVLLSTDSSGDSGREFVSRKRTSSFFDGSNDDRKPAISVANKWAMQTSSDPESDTKAEAVDRHCKIRFVEKLTSVISETGGESIVQEALPDSVMTAANAKDGSLVVDTEEMKGLDDEELDRILDSLLVRIVETLVEISPSECNVEDLTATDKSGFTLLHYAALYNLQSLIPVLLSRGANPDIQSMRGAVTPLHLACGAGNTAIVELLLRHGCAICVPDSYGSYPVDHAYRNGFTSLAAQLEEKMVAEKGLRNGAHVVAGHDAVADAKRKQSLKEIERDRLQSAFENLSLKDKMILNMILKHRKKKVDPSKSKNHVKVETIIEETSENEDDIKMEEYPTHDPVLTENKLKQLDAADDTWASKSTSHRDSDGLSIESLDIAMRLMDDEELDELQNKSADIHKDLKQWMLKRNYESLKEASEYLHNTLEEYKKGTKSGPSESQPSMKSPEENLQQKAKIRSLQNMKSQALAALVLRKKLLALRGKNR